MDKFAQVDKLAVDFSKLSKKERKKLKRELEKTDLSKKSQKAKLVKWSIIIIALLLVLFGGWWGYKELSKPLPGSQFADLGRDHVAREKWEQFTYNSNPPTSGPHDATWVKAGIYEQAQLEGMLVHSLEHGYIVISYNCGGVGMADGREKEATASTESGANLEIGIAPLSEEKCNTLKKHLSDLANDKKLWKLIVVPRQNLDSRIALTAWTYLLKLDDFDKGRIVAFIDAHRNHGPEQTME